MASKHLNFLIVEDNKYALDLIKIILIKIIKNKKLLLTTADDGRSAINYAKKTKFDLIFMDINIPYINGIDATKKIKQLNGLNFDTKIVAYTARNETPEYFQVNGFDFFIIKPIRKESLEKLLVDFVI